MEATNPTREPTTSAPSSIPTPTDYEVVVVGFGPTGAVAACWLGQAGIRTLAIDKSRSIWQIPRAVAIDHEILRVFQNLGVSEQVLPYTAPFPASEHFGAQGQLIRRIDAVPPPYPLGYVPTMVFTQPAVESILRERADSHSSVKISLGVEAVAITQTDEVVTLDLVAGDGNTESVTAAYVLACDGASSSIRRLLGINLHDLGFDEPWLVVDVKVNERSLDKLPHTAAQYCNPARPTTFIIGPGNHRRWEIMLLPEEDPRLMEKEDNVWRLLAPWLQPADGELWRASSYRFHALITEEWRKARIFLAGDAAHQQPPFIGQGMCQGIRDVTNLAWKLQAVLAGQATDGLLDTYGEERGKHVHTLTSRIKAIGHHICERDPEAARIRDESLIAQGGGIPPTVTRQEIVPPLEIGVLAPIHQKANGSLFPQPWIVSAHGVDRLDNLIPAGWWAIFDGRFIARAEVPQLPITTIVIGREDLQEQDGIVARWFEENECVGAVIRPDHYVYGVIRGPDEAISMLRALWGQFGIELIQHPSD
jgi:3-(3-hydroxy-phenyl)propionate hydroxylase